jgi:Ca2+/H+ antiporter, TMEM165/GDT1 family
MDVLIPVFIAVLLAEMGGRVQVLAHRLALGGTQARTIWIALFLSTLVSFGVAGTGGAYVSTLISFKARTLLAGLALLFAGGPMLLWFRHKEVEPDHPSLTVAISRFALAQFGDASQFIVFGLAATSVMPVLGPAGGLCAVMLAAAPPILMGKDWPGPVPLRLLRVVAAILLIAGGGWLAVSALRLI